MKAGVALIGVGNPWRGDDGIGWTVAETAGRLLGDRVEVSLCDGEPSRLIDWWADRGLAVVVDATHGGGEPGTVRVWHGDVPARSRPPAASHSFGIDHAIALGAVLSRLPERLVIIGIEAGDTAHGNELSPAVAAAVQPAADAAISLIRSWNTAGASSPAVQDLGATPDQ